MSTHATISIETPNEPTKTIYCHFDGYISGIGEILNTHYKFEDKIHKLIDLGDISSLGKYVDQPEGHSFENRIEGYTVAYGRDRGDKDTAYAKIPYGMEPIYDIEAFNYIYKDGQWFVYYIEGGEECSGKLSTFF